MKEDILLIGNSPKASLFKVGDAIDAFPGQIVRFNAAQVSGFEDRVGRRTDIWVTCGDSKTCRAEELNTSEILFSVPRGFKDFTREYWDLFSSKGNLSDVSREDYDFLSQEMGHHPSSGALVASRFLRAGHRVYLYGFSYFDKSINHHYWNTYRTPLYHSPFLEEAWFRQRIEDSLLSEFHPEHEQSYLINQYKELYSHDGYHGHASGLYCDLFSSVFERLKIGSFLDYGCGRSVLARDISSKLDLASFCYDPGFEGNNTWSNESVDLVYTTDVLEHVPLPEIAPLLNKLRGYGRFHLHAISTRPASKLLSDGQNAHCTVRSASWWGGYLTSIYTDQRVRSLRVPQKDIAVFLITD